MDDKEQEHSKSEHTKHIRMVCSKNKHTKELHQALYAALYDQVNALYKQLTGDDLSSLSPSDYLQAAEVLVRKIGDPARPVVNFLLAYGSGYDEGWDRATEYY